MRTKLPTRCTRISRNLGKKERNVGKETKTACHENNRKKISSYNNLAIRNNDKNMILTVVTFHNVNRRINYRGKWCWPYNKKGGHSFIVLLEWSNLCDTYILLVNLIEMSAKQTWQFQEWNNLSIACKYFLKTMTDSIPRIKTEHILIVCRSYKTEWTKINKTENTTFSQSQKQLLTITKPETRYQIIFIKSRQCTPNYRYCLLIRVRSASDMMKTLPMKRVLTYNYPKMIFLHSYLHNHVQ